MSIEPLSKTTLEDALSLVNETFPHQGIEPASITLRGSLGIHPYDWFVHLVDGIPSLKYWIAREEDEVMGITGLYSYKKDENEAVWIGWTCVHPEHRGKGIGKSLYGMVIGEARKSGKQYLRVYTSTNPNEAVANLIYDKLGFEVFDKRHILFSKFEMLYKQLKLRQA